MIFSDFIETYLYSKYKNIRQSTNNQQCKQHKLKRYVNEEFSYCFNNDEEEPKYTLICCQILLFKKYSNYSYIVSSDAKFKLKYASKNGHKSKSKNIIKILLIYSLKY